MATRATEKGAQPRRRRTISDAITAVLARRARLSVVTEDRDFEALARLVPGLEVPLYDRRDPAPEEP